MQNQSQEIAEKLWQDSNWWWLLTNESTLTTLNQTNWIGILSKSIQTQLYLHWLIRIWCYGSKITCCNMPWTSMASQNFSKWSDIRTDINRWLLWEVSAWFGACYVYLVENCVKPVLDASPDPKILEDQDPKFHKLAGILDSRLAQNEWIAGNSPTIADIAYSDPMYLNGWQKPP